jgi:plastocyanin
VKSLLAASGLLLVSAVFADASAATHTITIRDMRYGRAPATLTVGDTVIWKNEDIFQHTATDKAGAFDVKLPPGASASVTLTRAGRLQVFCRYHPEMVLRLEVRR